MTQPRYSFVLPVYNEQETLSALHGRIASVLDRLDGPAEVVLVDDGSSDATPELLDEINAVDPRFKVVHLSRNFGHQLAVTAGLDFASGEAVIVMDADLQDPPEVALNLIERWREGYEVVYAVRADRRAEPWAKRTATKIFYRSLRKLTDVDIPPDVGDFRLVDRKALDVFKQLNESNRYVRGMFSWIGFRQTGVPYTRSRREWGTTHYPLGKLIKLGADGVVSFSNAPLRLALILGFVVSALAAIAAPLAIVLKLMGFIDVPGWASLIVVITFLGGVQLVVTGMLGLYVGRIYEEVKERPLYVVRDSLGFEPELQGPPRVRPAVKRRG